MKNKTLMILAACSVLIVVLMLPVYLDSTVHVFPVRPVDIGDGMYLANVAGPCPYGKIGGRTVNPPAPACVQSLPSHGADVYTTNEIDAINSTLQGHLADITKSEVSAAEQRISGHLTDSINALPQRLISEAAKDEIKKSLQAEFKAQMDELRSDFQKQIDELKAAKLR